jgi:uncharacterized metal-binding protein YceD (DUF177 family)
LRQPLQQGEIMMDKANPWSLRLAVAQIPDVGLHRELEANPDQRSGLAALAGVREVSSADAWFDLALMRGGRVQVTGRVTARLGQTCVVTLEPIENDIDEAIDLIYAPPEQIPALADLVDDAAETGAAIPDPPEPIVDGMIDLGRLATDALLLAIDPYPRKPGAMFELQAAPADPEDHPFAALKSLGQVQDSPNSKKPKP